MKIVMCYSSCSYDFDGPISFDHVLCFEYESLEALYVHFEEACKEAYDNYIQGQSEMKAWNAMKPLSYHRKTKEDYEKVFAEWLAKRPNFHYAMEFAFAGCVFRMPDFVPSLDHVDPHRSPHGWSFAGPDLYELNQWFDKCCVRKV